MTMPLINKEIMKEDHRESMPETALPTGDKSQTEAEIYNEAKTAIQGIQATDPLRWEKLYENLRRLEKIHRSTKKTITTEKLIELIEKARRGRGLTAAIPKGRDLNLQQIVTDFMAQDLLDREKAKRF